ncbi:hypothetical protein Ddye_008271 [Dipteronia dyeriana]|uniref:Uncharacterized protein n=1 Tax=Dipteronia dyeriana TaxID=168575 RepID=A0AAD9X991_9ROSI|nr:hypothetical protein Ddye_008271 [Dipteronia dyeriana]
MEPKGRPLGITESSWCRAVHGGTGIAVLAILSSKTLDSSHYQKALNKLQNSHPILRSRLHTNPSKNTFLFVTSPTPFVQIKPFSISSTFKILEESSSSQENVNVSPLQLILEHELNENAWCNRTSSNSTHDLFFASTYTLPNDKLVAVLRLHVAACDHTTAASLLRELLVLAGDEEGGGVEKEIGRKGEVSLGIEDLIPKGQAKKGLWSRGMDMLSYSVNSFRLSHLKFNDVKSPRCSKVVRFQINKDDTQRILLGCKLNGIKLCGAVAAAGLMAAHNSKRHSDHQRKYAVVTLTDCRSILDPPLSNHHFGFYHSAIMNTHVMKGSSEQMLWDAAKRMYKTFANSKDCYRHFSDMADLNFLMCKAIENPGLTSSASLRTAFMTVFEDVVIDDSGDMQKRVGVEDYMGCASAHGIGPSIGVFDTIRDGSLDCVCVYPSPLHSMEQMQLLTENMKSILVDGSKICGV